ncbi:MAG: penicillin-binding protein 2, partial [Acidobacteriota bacterium]|nr:penicillin-binding protein 2 [Acidobacteriota bacterium]
DRWELKEYLLEQRLSWRVTLFHVGVVALLVSYALGFWYLQVIHGDEYAAKAELNRLRREPLLPMRGVVHDRNGVVIASTRPSLRLMLVREGLRDKEPQLRRLERLLAVPYENFENRLERAKDRPVFEPAVLMDDLALDQLAPIEARREQFPSVEFDHTELRTYPQIDVVAHVLGYVGEVSEDQLAAQPVDGPLKWGDVVGKSGVEEYYDDRVRGERGSQLVTVNSMGRQLGEPRLETRPRNGQDLRLTLDLRLQWTLVDALEGEVGAGVFMDPRNGEVLAIASTPTYDPNLFASGISTNQWQAILNDRDRPLHDRTIASFYAPGSTFKIVMAVAGLETGAVSPSTVVTCKGWVHMYGRNVLCWKRGGHGPVNLEKALIHSCNVYFYELGRQLGIEAIHKYGAVFGLGRPTGIDLPREESGILPSNEWKMKHKGEKWFPGETISVAIGQGLLAVTPVQLARMTSAVATSGSLPRPHLRIDDRPEPVTLDVAPETFRLVQAAMRKAVRTGTGQKAALDGIEVAGKTGTAQVYKHSAGIDADDLPKDERDHAWFVGYAPADDPLIAFAVVVEHGGHGGTTAAPVARAVLETFFSARDADDPSQQRASHVRPGEVIHVGTSSAR